jgi:hypothetical protein
LASTPSQAQDGPYGCDSFLVEESFMGIGDAYYTDYFTGFSTLLYRSLFQDDLGGLHLAYVANYELFYFYSSDGGASWSQEQVITGHEGGIYRAVIAADASGLPYIAFTAHDLFNYGNPTFISFGSEFYYDAYLAFPNGTGWTVENAYTHSTSNVGYKVNDLRIDPSGAVTIYGHRYGWSSFGGEVWAVTRNATGDWGGVDVLQAYSDVGIDKFLAKVMFHEAPDGVQTLIYGRSTNPSGYPEVAAIQGDGVSWSGPMVISGHIDNQAAFDWTANSDGTLWTVAINNDADPPLLWSTNLDPAVPLDLPLEEDTNVTAVRVHMDADHLLNLMVWFAGGENTYIYVSPDSGATWCAPFVRPSARTGGWLPATNGATGTLPSFGFPIIRRVSTVEPFGPDSLLYVRVSHGDTATQPSALPVVESLTQELMVYPNPSHGWAQVSWTATDAADWQIRILDVHGRTLEHRQLGRFNAGNLTVKLQLETLPSGTYILELIGAPAPNTLYRETRRLMLAH